MSDEQDKLKLSLEAPKLFGRKKKSADEPATSEAAEPTPATPEAEVEVDEVDEPTAALEAVEADPEPVVEEPEPVAVEPEPEPVAVEPEPEPVAVEPEPEPVEPEPEPEPVAVKPKPKPAPKAAPTKPKAAAEDAGINTLDTAGPLLTIYRAAALTGLVVGASMVVLTWLALRGCGAVRGASSCGGGPGFLLLIAIFAICVLLGSALLKTFLIPDPGSSSFLAVGLVAVVALLFLIDALDHWSMLIIIPVLTIGGYLASVWVTKTFVEPAPE